jgi:nitrate reductase NapD
MSEYHVCGVLLMTRPEHSPLVEKSLREMPGVELHANDGGRMVVTVEGDAYKGCADTITALSTLKGVASSSLVYHQLENETPPEEIQS